MEETKPLIGIFALLEEIQPEPKADDLKEIVDLNKGAMKKFLEGSLGSEFYELTDQSTIEKLKDDEKLWVKPRHSNLKRKMMFGKLLKFTKKRHIEMLDVSKIRELVPIKMIKAVMRKPTFINFSIKKKYKNLRLTQQDYILQIFLNYHMRHDMKFKAKVDSLDIEMDNPFARQQIRDENRKDPVIGKKYLKDMEVDEWCKFLLETFFPNMSGIWADHTHMIHSHILETVRFCYECGFVDLEDTEVIINLLYGVCVSLLKLEESWTEKLDKVRKISEAMQANFVTRHFAKCREHMACILVQILTLYQDEYFIRNFSSFKPGKGEHNPKKMTEQYESFIKDLRLGSYPFFNQQQNDIIMFICMNYLSVTLKIDNFKTTDEITQRAVEKIFLYITTDHKDCFIESIKQVTSGDLKYFSSKVDPISETIRDKCDGLGYSFKTLLEFVGMGCFRPSDMKMIKKIENNVNYQMHLTKYVEETTYLPAIVQSLINDMKAGFDDIDFRVGLVKESVPLMILALADYITDQRRKNPSFKEKQRDPTLKPDITEYFEATKERNDVISLLFDTLFEICLNNNNAMGQIFKGDGLYHLKSMIEKHSKHCLFFLNRLCEANDNIAIFLGRGFLDEIISVYKEIQADVLNDVKIAVDDINKEDSYNQPLDEEIDIDDWIPIIILNNFFTKLMKKTFLSDREKIQSGLRIQEAIYPSLESTLMECLIFGLKQRAAPRRGPDLQLKKGLFREGNEVEMVRVLEQRKYSEQINYEDLSVIISQLCFSSLQAFNMSCANAFSSQVWKSMESFIEDLKEYLFNSPLDSNKPTDPYGMDAELVKLLKHFVLIPESNLMIERNFDLHSEDNQVFDETDPALDDITMLLRRCVQYEKTHDLRGEGQKFVIEGVLPYIYKYAASLLNLTHYEVEIIGVNPLKHENPFSGEKRDYKPSKKLNPNNIDSTIIIVDQLYKIYREYREKLVNLMDREITNTLFTNIENMNGKGEMMDEQHMKTEKILGKKTKKKENLEEMTNRIITICRKMLKDIEKFYIDSDYVEEMQQFKEISQEEFEELSSKARFPMKAVTEDDQDRIDTLNFYLSSFQDAKKHYLDSSEGSNLISFFDKNTDNLLGVFASCVDRLYEVSKKERFDTESKLTNDNTINRFWMNQSCYAYVKIIEKLIAGSKTARDEFYHFITETEENFDDDSDSESIDLDDDELDEEALKFDLNAMGDIDAYETKFSGMSDLAEDRNRERHKQQNTDIKDRERLVGTLMRIQHDILLFLTTSPTQKPIWWNINQIYQMLCSFFKNLCENNHIDFKNYLASKVPKTKDEEWNKDDQSCVQIFADQLMYLLEASKLAENRESIMIHSDQHSRIQPLLLPLMNILNEAMTGPCKANQKIVANKNISEIFQILTRIVEHLDDEFMELKHSALIFILSLSEGFNRRIMSIIASKATPSLMLNQIQRIMKQVYVSQLIKNGTFKSEVRKRAAEREREIQMRKMKKKAVPIKNLDEIMEEHDHETAANQISPISINKMNTLSKMNAKDFDPNHVTQEMENSVYIRDWEYLLDMYKELEEFSNGILFDFVFRMVILWKVLTKYSKKHNSRYKELLEDAKQCFEGGNSINSSPYQQEIASVFYFIQKIMLHVEIVDPNGNNLLVYFPQRPACFFLPENSKTDYRQQCNIDDPSTKMLDLTMNFKLFNIQMEQNLAFFRKSPFLYRAVSKDAFGRYNKVAWTLGFLINVFMAFAIIRPEPYKLEAYNDNYNVALIVCSYVLVGFSGFSLIAWFIFRFRQRAQTLRETFIFENPGVDPDTFINKCTINIYQAIMGSITPINMGLHLIFTLIGISAPYYLFITFNLLLVVNISTTSRFVVKSITLHADQLIATLILTLFMIYSYTIILSQDYYRTLDLGVDDPEELDLCRTLYECFTYTVNWGLRNGGGIADSMNVEPKGRAVFYFKNFYDVSFFIVINVIALNIIFGVIIDTFGELRDQQQERGKLN